MNQNTSMPAKYKYYYIGQWQFILTFIGIMIRVILGFEFTMIEAGIYILDAFILFYIVMWFPMKKKETANRESMGIDFFEGPIVANKGKKEDFFLGFKRYVEIHVDWDDDESLKEYFNSKTYDKYLQELIKEDAVRDFRKRVNSNSIKSKIIDSIAIDLKKYKKRVGNNPSVEEKRKLDDKKRELEMAKKSTIPFREFDITQITKDDKEKLRKLRWYFVELYDDERFKDHEKGFDKVLIACNGDFSRILRTEPSLGWYQGWNIDLRSLNVFWILWWWLSDTMPVLFLKFSENMIEEEIDTIANMRALAMTYAQLKVMEKWLYHLSTLPEKLMRENERLEQRAKSFEASYAYVIQDLMNDNLVYSRLIKDEVQEDLRMKLSRQKKKTNFLYVLIGMILLMIVVICSLVMTGTTMVPPKIF